MEKKYFKLSVKYNSSWGETTQSVVLELNQDPDTCMDATGTNIAEVVWNKMPITINTVHDGDGMWKDDDITIEGGIKTINNSKTYSTPLIGIDTKGKIFCDCNYDEYGLGELAAGSYDAAIFLTRANFAVEDEFNGWNDELLDPQLGPLRTILNGLDYDQPIEVTLEQHGIVSDDIPRNVKVTITLPDGTSGSDIIKLDNTWKNCANGRNFQDELWSKLPLTVDMTTEGMDQNAQSEEPIFDAFNTQVWRISSGKHLWADDLTIGLKTDGKLFVTANDGTDADLFLIYSGEYDSDAPNQSESDHWIKSGTQNIYKIYRSYDKGDEQLPFTLTFEAYTPASEEYADRVVKGDATDAFLKKVKEYIDEKGQPDMSKFATKSWVEGQYINIGKIWKGTQAQYSALSKYDSETIYFIEEE